MNPKRIEISYKTIIFTVLFLISLKVLWELRSLIFLLFICFIFMEAVNPIITRLEKIKIPRALSIIILYLIILTVVSFALSGIIPILIEQTAGLINTLPTFLANVKILGTSAIDLSSQLKILENLPANIAKTVFSVFSNVFSAFIVFVVTFYLLMERKNFPKYSFSIFGTDGKNKTIKAIENLENRLGSWVSAEILLMTIIGILAYLGYSIIGLNYAVPLAIIAGLLEVVPNIGPTVSTAMAAIVGLTVSPLTALMTVIWGIVIQQLENNFIVPKIMKETVGLNPLITILLIASGAKLGGIGGAILAVPVYLTFETIIKVVNTK